MPTRNLIQEMSCPSPRNIVCNVFENLEVKKFFSKSTDSRKFNLELILLEKSVRKACRQMQAVVDSILCAISISWLILKNYQFLANLSFTQKWAGHFLYQISCSQRLRGIIQMMQKKRTFWRKIVRCSFKSFEQCISYEPVNEDTSYDSHSFSEENQSYQI